MSNIDLALSVFLVVTIFITMIKYEGEKEEKRGERHVK